MTYLTETWLRLPSVEPDALDRAGIGFHAAQKVGGVRQGKTGWVLPAYVDPPSCWRMVEDPVLLDFVVFDPAQPRQFRTVYDDAAMLGEEALREARWDRLPLPVFRDPLGWLQSGGAGVLPLDLPRFAVAVTSCPAIELVGEDVEHGRWLKRIAEHGLHLGLPRISVAEAA